jgi:serine protease Do
LKRKIILFVLALLFCVLAVAFFYVLSKHLNPSQKKISLSHQECVTSARKLQNAFSHVAEKALPAVVVIKTSVRPESQKNYLRRWLGLRRPPKEGFIPTTQGSGFFVSQQGHIVTNYHIVKGQKAFRVILNNKNEYNAELVGVDPKTDLAVLKIAPEEELSILEFADIRDVRVGHWAIAVGAPYSLDYTVTAGIVSHIGRSVGLNVYESYIQTDAAVNPGNSGGPLLNLHGEVIGINDFIMTSSPYARGSIGLSFAISSEIATRIIRELIEKGEVERPWLGIAMADLKSSASLKLGLKGGVVVTAVYPDDPAEYAGIIQGDIILEINGFPVKSSIEFSRTVLKYRPGDTLTLLVYRKGLRQKVNVKAGKQDKLEMDGTIF